MNMKNFLLRFVVVALILLGASCEKPYSAEDEEGGSDIVIDDKNNGDDTGNKGDKTDFVTVKFNIRSVERQESATVTLRDVCQRLSFSVFDADGERCNYQTISQLRDDKDFGNVSISIAKGSYSFVFVAENGEKAPTISKPTSITFRNNKLTDTYYYYGVFDVDAEKSYDIALKCATAKLSFAVNDAVPSGIDRMEFYYTGGSSTLDAPTGYGAVNSKQTETRNVESAAHSGKSVYELYTIPHEDNKPLTLRVSANVGDKAKYVRTVSEIKVERGVEAQFALDFFGEDPEGGR